MSAYPGGGGTVASPPLYPDYINPTVFIVNGNSASLSPFSGPKGSPFDAKMYPSNVYQPKPSDIVANTADHSTGGLNTGIGFETTDNGQLVAGIDTGNVIVTTSGTTKGIPANGPGSLNGFTDEYQPGISMPSGALLANTVLATGLYGAVLTAIGGGKSTANGTTVAQPPTVPAPYNIQPLLDMGVGGSRDAGAGPAFTGFGMKSVIATAGVAQGAAIETGWINRTAPAASGISLLTGKTAFGSSTAASPAVA